MKPTKEEIQLFIEFSIINDEKRMGELESQRNEVLTQLKAPNLNNAKRKSLKDHLKSIDQLIIFENQRKEEEKAIPDYGEIKKDALKQVASTTVTNWKFNKALYNKYEGRVIFQQAGWEPIDAYKTFWDEQLNAKTFEVFDASFGPIFDSMDEYFEMGHSYMTKEDADKYFSKPWWDPTFEPL